MCCRGGERACGFRLGPWLGLSSEGTLTRVSMSGRHALDAVWLGLLLSLSLLFVGHFAGSEPDSVSKESSESVQNFVVVIKVDV